MTSYDRYPPRYPWSSYLWPLLLLLGVGALLLWRFTPGLARIGTATAALSREVTPRRDLFEDEKLTIDVFNRCSPSAVHITTSGRPSRRNPRQIPRGTGSGFIWDREGRVVTNYHVIQGAASAQVTLADGSDWLARLVGGFPDKDLAVLVIDAPRNRLHPIPIGTSHDLQVGQKVFAIGNPFGLDQTLTTGVISALNREIEAATDQTIAGVIQTDAAPWMTW